MGGNLRKATGNAALRSSLAELTSIASNEKPFPKKNIATLFSAKFREWRSAMQYIEANKDSMIRAGSDNQEAPTK
eukprot:2753862-Alexandrium_andersonii.AAC.1